ncbi:MAG: ABC transporter permease [Acidimicrobiales bacterium]
MALEAPAQPPDAGTTAAARGGPLPPTRPASRGPKPTRVVSADVGIWQRLVAIWGSRELLVYLVRTEIKVKYKNSFLGLLWSMLSPALNILVYTIVFGVFLKSVIPNFVIFLFSGLLLWNFFSTGVLTATGVIVSNAGLVKKVSFPREILALAAIGSAGVFFFFQSLVMVLFLILLHNTPAWSLLWMVLVALGPTMVLAVALGILLASVNVYLRDTQHLVTVLVGSAWFWACPIVYSYAQVAKGLANHGFTTVFFLNPMTVPVMTFERVLYNKPGLVHSAVHGQGLVQVLPSWPVTTYVWGDAIVLAVGLALFYVAMVVFGRLAGNFAEEL